MRILVDKAILEKKHSEGDKSLQKATCKSISTSLVNKRLISKFSNSSLWKSRQTGSRHYGRTNTTINTWRSFLHPIEVIWVEIKWKSFSHLTFRDEFTLERKTVSFSANTRDNNVKREQRWWWAVPKILKPYSRHRFYSIAKPLLGDVRLRRSFHRIKHYDLQVHAKPWR